jgi:hypothetical protein
MRHVPWDGLGCRQCAAYHLITQCRRERGVHRPHRGDAIFAVLEAVSCPAAADAQRALTAEACWGRSDPRQDGIHTGEAHLAGDDWQVRREPCRSSRRQATAAGRAVGDDGDARRGRPGGKPCAISADTSYVTSRAERLRQLDIVGLATDFPPLRTGAARRASSRRLTSFRGRDEELRAGRALDEVTRDADRTEGSVIEPRHRRPALADGFPDGAWFINLAAIEDPGR